MGKPKKLNQYKNQGYPTLAEFSQTRRNFLKQMAVSVVSIGAGMNVLSACGSEKDFEIAGGFPNPQELLRIRLPREGFVSVSMDKGDYMRFAMKLQTRNKSVANHYTTNPNQGIELAKNTLKPLSCGVVSDEQALSGLEEDMRLALEESVTQLISSNDGIVALQLLVDTCEDGDIAGGLG